MPSDLLHQLAFHQTPGAHREDWHEFTATPAERAVYQLDAFWSPCDTGFSSRAYAERSRDLLAAHLGFKEDTGPSLRIVRAHPGGHWRAPWLIITEADPFAGRAVTPCPFAWCQKVMQTMRHVLAE